MNKKVFQAIKDLKGEKYGDIIIPCKFGEYDYELVFLTSECCKNFEIMNLLSKWRKKHEFWFQAQFEITVDRTISWFNKRVIETEDRLLFMLRLNGEYIGHVGLFRFDLDADSCEIDNIVRGEDGVPGIMGDAVIQMMDWGRKTLGIKLYTLQTTSDNTRALKLYERLGFKEFKKIPLVYNDQDKEWSIAPDKFIGKIERYDIFMHLKK